STVSPSSTSSSGQSPSASHSASSAPPRPTTSTTTAARPTTASTAVAARLALVVLNNTTTSGLAEQARSSFQAGGWTVTNIGNLRNDIISTCAYYDPTAAGAQAGAAALQAQFPAIKRTAPKFAGLPSGPIVVVLTSDYVSG
ncbi:MAG: LytR C-terminal domain-containing protein, partial [Actinomycetota bacterium]|nr:LytR C-terminal domain-containing protein [Actinomycetota bacterium]